MGRRRSRCQRHTKLIDDAKALPGLEHSAQRDAVGQRRDRHRDQSNDADGVTAHVSWNVQQSIDDQRSCDNSDDREDGGETQQDPARRPNDGGDAVVVVRGEPFRHNARQRSSESKIEQ